MKVALVLLLVVGAALAQQTRQEPEVRITKQTFEDNGDGTYSFSFVNSDGTEREERGFLKNPGTENEILVQEGSYTYVDTDGKLVRVKYIADEKGFQILEDNRI